MSYRTITWQMTDHVGRITLNQPDAANAVTRPMADELDSCCARANQDEDVRVVILTGAGAVFSSGDARTAQEDPMTMATASEAIASLKMPVIAAFNGDATGSGLELALACDLRLAADTAHFGLTQTTHAAIPSGGGTQRLPRIVGRGKALELILTAAAIGAEEAWRVGLVNRILPAAELMPEAESLAAKLASKGPISARYAKEAMNKGLDMPLGQGLRLEADLSFLLQSTKDRAEGISAFLEKRAPEFKGE